jgi:tetratricopeptide (TPR) repeat protein
MASAVLFGVVLAACGAPEPTKISATATSAAHHPGDPTATPPGEDIADADYHAGKEAYRAGEYEAVLPLMEAVLDRNPALAPPHWYRGMAFWRLEDCAAGLAEMELALELDPGYALAWADRGLMRACLGNEAGALGDYRKALTLDPSLAKVHERLGAYFFNSGDSENALEEHTLAVEIDPTRASAWVARAQMLDSLLRFEECIDSATEALQVDPEHWPAYNIRGVCALEIGDYERGVADYERYTVGAPDDPDGWYNLGFGYRRIGQPENAVAAYTQALLIDPTYVEAVINRGRALIDLGRFEALPDQALDFGDPRCLNGRGEAYMALGASMRRWLTWSGPSN